MEEKVEEKASSWTISSFSDNITNLYLNDFSVSKYYILFDDYKHNHLAHGMVALLKLGSNDSTIKDYMEDHAKIFLETIQEYESNNKISLKSSPCQWSSFTQYLGGRKNYYGLFEMFKNKLNKQHNNNVSELLSEVFPILSSGVCGGAFHGIIHLGYGVSVNNTQIILEGLSLLTMQYLEFRHKPSKNKQKDTNDEKSIDDNITLIDVLNLVRSENKLKNIILKYKDNKNNDITNLSLFGNEIISNYVELIVDKIPKSIKEIKEWLLSTVINLYCYINGLDFNDFFILHGVTSAWSLIQLLPHLKTNKLRENAVLEFLHGFIAIYAVQGQHEFIKGQDTKYDNKQLQEFKTKTLEIINNIKPKDNQKSNFKRVHILKVTHIILECMELNIVDAKCAFDTINLVQKEFHF